MLVLRVVVIFAALFLAGMGLAFIVTRDRKFLRISLRFVQALAVLLVASGLVYVFSRVLLF